VDGLFVFGFISGRLEADLTSVAGRLTDVVFCFGVASLSHLEDTV